MTKKLENKPYLQSTQSDSPDQKKANKENKAAVNTELNSKDATKPSFENISDSASSSPIEKGGYRDKNLPEPTRYGDWEVGGRCSDF